ncbi:hypothetical protein EJ06DRAFT_585611 [Trichodelitschia bisporula]|uniref:ABM domain-containing protein n=1 Tax=Trichodelitschia bisporula TaxID=703511 RepID=A0A6G1HJ21_9PEZI|nr:hypothetical protein EJ06DRAFT_585611 [Trichodelitschia bisporula]
MPFIIAYLPTTSRAARDELLTLAAAVACYAQAHEPGVTRYAACVPLEDETGVWMVEEYATSAAFSAHVATAEVNALVSFMSVEGRMRAAPEVYELSVVHGGEIRGREVGIEVGSEEALVGEGVTARGADGRVWRVGERVGGTRVRVFEGFWGR